MPRIIRRVGRARIALKSRARIEKTTPRAITIITIGSARAPITSARIPKTSPIIIIAIKINILYLFSFTILFHIYRRNNF